MGREIRRVPGDWEHPKWTEDTTMYTERIGDYRPLHDEDYQSACAAWYEGLAEFKPTPDCNWYHEYDGDPPDELYYRGRMWTPEEATHYQVYETVSEGSPVTPVFATKELLVDYLVANGDFWDQKRGHGGWLRENAEKFVQREYSMSFVTNMTDGTIKAPRDGA